jgi:hypothetical protein
MRSEFSEALDDCGVGVWGSGFGSWDRGEPESPDVGAGNT